MFCYSPQQFKHDSTTIYSSFVADESCSDPVVVRLVFVVVSHRRDDRGVVMQEKRANNYSQLKVLLLLLFFRAQRTNQQIRKPDYTEVKVKRQ